MSLDRHAVPGAGVSLATGGLVAVIGILVLGILGMHSLTLHGATPGHGTHQPVAPTSATHETAGHAGLAQAAAGHASTGETAQASAHSDAVTPAGNLVAAAPTRGGSLAHMATLCAVMFLAAAASALLALRLRRLAQATLTHLKPLARTYTTLHAGRDETGPPPVWEFSVIRC